MNTMHQEGNALIYENDGELLRIEPWGKNSLRVRSVMQGQICDTDYALIELNEAIVTSISVSEYEASITNGKITARIEVSNWNHKCVISYYNQNKKLLLKETGDGGALNKDSRRFHGIIGGAYNLHVSFASAQNEKLFGMGQYQQDDLDLKYTTLELAHRNSQASVPFVLSSLGYGFLWHNPAIGQVTFGKNVTDWYAASTKQMDYWITAGDTPDEIEQAYGRAVGTTPMMPEYGLGFWQCKLRYWNQEQLLSVARKYHEKKIPVDVIVCDFFHWPKMGDFRFEEEFFPDPDAMVKELKEMGMELMVSVWPQIDTVLRFVCVLVVKVFSLILLILLHAAMYGINAVKTIMIKVSAYSGWMKQSLNILAMIMTTIATILDQISRLEIFILSIFPVPSMKV